MSIPRPSSRSRVQKGVPTGGQFAASAHSESTLSLGASPDADQPTPEQTDPATPKRLRNAAQVRTNQAFLDAMEAAETESRVSNLDKGDWVREFGDDEWGVVKRVGLHTLATDTWSDSDTDEGDHVVAVVRKDVGDALLAEHGALPSRVVTVYVKRRTAALGVADRFMAASADQGTRRMIGTLALRKAARDVWLSGKAAGLAADPEFPSLPSRHSTREFQAMEQAYLDYNSMTSVAGHSDVQATRLVQAMREAIAHADQHFDPAPRTVRA